MKNYEKLIVPEDSAWNRKTISAFIWRNLHWRIRYFIGGIKKPWTVPLNPINRFLVLNSKLFPGAYWDYYIKEIQFFAEILKRNPNLARTVFATRKKCVNNAPKWTFYLKARFQKYLNMKQAA